MKQGPTASKARAAVCSAAMMLAGCATFEHGAVDEVHVISEPTGAQVTVSYGADRCVTPCTLIVPRGTGFTVYLDKDGYTSQSVDVQTKSTASADVTSHDLTTDYLGRVIDTRVGAYFIHVPNPVTVKLTKE